MREIKFRAWIKGHFEEGVTGKMLYDENPGDSLRWYNEGQPVEVMQYTGLKDKNGKEIYEGDIISYYTTKRYIQQSHPEVRPEIDELYLAKKTSAVKFICSSFNIEDNIEDFGIMNSLDSTGLISIEDVKQMIFGEDSGLSEEEMMCDMNGKEITEEIIGIKVIGNIYQNPELINP